MQLTDIAPIAASVSALAAIVGAFAATRSARNTAQALQDANTRAVEQARPLLIAELRKYPDPNVKWIQELVIRNLGKSIAREVRVTFDPEIPDSTPPDQRAGSVTSALVRRFAKIPALAPDAAHANIYMVGEDDGTGLVRNSEPTPDQVKVTLTYTGPEDRTYTDSFDLDINDIGLSTSARRVTRGTP